MHQKIFVFWWPLIDQDGVLSLQEFVRVLRALGKPCKLFNLSTPKIVFNIFYLKMTKTAPSGHRKKYQLTKPTTVSLSMNSSLSTENTKRRRIHLSIYWNVLKCSTPRRREPSQRLSSGGLWPEKMGKSILTLTRWWRPTNKSTASLILRPPRERSISTIRDTLKVLKMKQFSFVHQLLIIFKFCFFKNLFDGLNFRSL